MSRKLLSIIALVFLFTCGVRAQSLDDFLGDSAASCPASLAPGRPGYSVTATCSQSGTQITCTLPAGQGANFDDLEPIYLSGSSTAMDTVVTDTTKLAGESFITNISGDVITLTSPVSATVSVPTTTTFKDGHFYVPLDASGNLVPVALPGWGNRRAICTPEGHVYFMIAVSDFCAGIFNGNCSIGPTTSNANTTRSANVATLTIAGTASTNWRWNAGMPITVSNCADASYDVSPGQTITFTNGNTFTYADVGADDPVGTTGCKIQAFGYNPSKYATFGGTQPDTRCNTQLGEMTRDLSKGFNAQGEVSDQYLDPTIPSPCNVGPSNSNTRWVPIFTGGSTPAASRYPGVNLWGNSTQPLKIPYYTVQPAITGKDTTEIFLDWAEPEWNTWLSTNWNPSTGANSFLTAETPWLIGEVFDDSDNMQQTHASGKWPAVGLGVPKPNPALLVLYSAPQITISNKALYTNGIWTTPLLFPDSKVYYKDLAVTPPSSCTTTAPCSLADFLRVKYGNIAALNTAWNTAYTTFGSSQSSFTGESVTTPASYTFLHTNITPRSVQVVLTPSGGSAIVVSGDCSLGMTDCPAGTAGTANFLAPPNCFNGGTANFYRHTGILCTDPNGDLEQVSTIGGTGSGLGETATAVPTWPANTACSGATTVSLNVTWTCVGPNITGTLTYATGASSFTIGGAGSLLAGETLTVNYTTGGWDAGGTGFEDEDGEGGRGGITFSNGVNMVCPETYTTGITVTAYDTEVAFQIAGSNFWALALTSGTTSTVSPAFTSNPTDIITDSDGIQWEMLGAPTSDAANGVNFNVACGTWNTTNATIAADLNSWVEEFFDFYFIGLNSISKPYHVLNFGVNFGMGSYNSPTWVGGLKAANQYTDGAFVGTTDYLTPDSSTAPLDKLTIDYYTKFFVHPVMIEPFLGSCAGDWQGQQKSCSPTFYNGLVARANAWYTIINNELSYTALDGTRPFTGLTWWPNHSNDQGGGSFALYDFMDNSIDGHENVTATVPCSGPLSTLSCGGEVSTMLWDGVNQETCAQCIVPANNLPYSGGGAPPASLPTSKPRGIIFTRNWQKKMLDSNKGIVSSLGGSN